MLVENSRKIEVGNLSLSIRIELRNKNVMNFLASVNEIKERIQINSKYNIPKEGIIKYADYKTPRK